MLPQRARSQVRVAREDIYLSSHRPAVRHNSPTFVAIPPTPPIVRPVELASKPAEAITLPDKGTRRAASLDFSTPSAPHQPPDTTPTTEGFNLSKDLARAAPPASSLMPTPLALPPSPSPPVPPPLKQHTAAASPTDHGLQPQPKMGAPATSSSVGEPVKLSNSSGPLDLPPAPPPPAIVASLPPSTESNDFSRRDDQKSKDIQENELQPTTSAASILLSVKVGQVSVEPRGTDVHIVLVNVASKELKDIDVRCRARDTQGLQTAEVLTRIADVAPSDITFGRVLFPSEITPTGNTFTCEVVKMAGMDDIVP